MRNFQVVDSSRVLVLEDDGIDRIPFFRQRLRDATIVRNPQVFLDAFAARDFSVVFLDFNVPCPINYTGLDVVRHLVTMGFSGRVVVHSANYWGARSMEKLLRSAGIPTAVSEFGSFDINRDSEPSVFDLGEI